MLFDNTVEHLSNVNHILVSLVIFDKLACFCVLPAFFRCFCLCTFSSTFLKILIIFHHFQLNFVFSTVAFSFIYTWMFFAAGTIAFSFDYTMLLKTQFSNLEYWLSITCRDLICIFLIIVYVHLFIVILMKEYNILKLSSIVNSHVLKYLLKSLRPVAKRKRNKIACIRDNFFHFQFFETFEIFETDTV